jgi:ligand-binding sensor domain-containing protein/DNA-binding response OmpR family regulator/nitrogen-specific signal transduction histidine kinase
MKMKKPFYIIAILSFVLHTLGLNANTPIIQLGVEQGLSNNHVVSITQDKDGFLWFATEEGLNRFDGLHFNRYYEYNGDLSGNELNYVLADPIEPVIWIATQRDGLNKYNYALDSIVIYKHIDGQASSLITNDITSIIQSSDGNLWLSTYHRGVEYFDKTTEIFTHFNTSTLTELPSDNVWSIMDDGEGRLFIGHVNHGLSVLTLENGRLRNYQHIPGDSQSIPGNEVRKIYKDSNHNIWVGTDKGLALFNADKGTFMIFDSSTNNALSFPISDIKQTNDNKLWVATELKGVYVLDLRQYFFNSDNELNVFHYESGNNRYALSNPSVRTVFQDSYNNIWLGTYGGGINFISHETPLFNRYSFSPIPDDIYGMNNRMALSIALDKEKRLWIGTDGCGINIFENGKRKKVLSVESDDLYHNTIQALMKDHNNDIWIGSFMGGVSYYNHKTGKIQTFQLDGTNNQDIRCFYEDDENNIWVGTSTGVYLIDCDEKTQEARYTSLDNGLPEDLVRSILVDSKKRIWIGTFGGGLALFTPEMELIQYFNEYNGFCSNTINYVYADTKDQVWVATGDGLVLFTDSDTITYSIIGREDGLENTYVRAITEDLSGNIWFTTNAGISVYLIDSNQIQHFDHEGTVSMNSFLSSVVNDEENGEIYFGSINGVYNFKPFTILQERISPPAIVTEMRVYEVKNALEEERVINYFKGLDEKIELSYKQNNFTIFFNIQDYALKDRVEYVYRLEGVDSNWQSVNENSVTFRGMRPGKYHFQVAAIMQNQKNHGEIFSLNIQIFPPFWLTWWAKVIYTIVLLLIILSVFYFYKKRVDIQSTYDLQRESLAREQEMNDERLRFYTNITHELRTPLTLIIGPLEDLQKDPQLQLKQSQKVSLIRKSALRLLDLINQLLEFRKVETQNKNLTVSKGNLSALVSEVWLKYKELNTKQNVKYRVIIESEEMVLYYDKEIVYSILDNLMTNALKNTEEGSITLSLRTNNKDDESYTEIVVEDTGCGIAKEELEHIFDRYYQVKGNRLISGSGIGLALIKKLAEIHEGQIQVESEINKGSRFTFSIKTHNIYPNALHSDETKENVQEIDIDKEIIEVEDSGEDNKQILLVVEDNKDIQNYISDSLSDLFEVLTASDGKEGLEVALSNIPDIIVSDIMMPGMDGITFCKMIKEDMRTSHIPLILLTAKTSLQDKEDGYESGADSYLTKPFSATLLKSRINNLMDSRRKLAEQFKFHIKLDKKSEIINNSINQLDNEFIEKITELILENMEHKKVDVGFLSEMLSMSSSTLYRKIKALTGISTNEFIRKVKMNRAEELLLTGKYTVSEVGYLVGISNTVYFRQSFKQVFGLAPTGYIDKIKEGKL